MDPERHRYLLGYGLIEMPAGECAVRLDGMPCDSRTVLRRSGSTTTDVASRYLRELSHPATRLALFPVNERWSAAVTNRRDGSDFADYTYPVSRHLRTRVCRIVDDDPGPPRRVGPYRVRVGHPARIFELHDAGGPVRTISCVLDGRHWTFETSGEPLPGEAESGYTAASPKDRFTSDDLRTLLRRLGIDRPVPDAFGQADHVHLFERTWKNWWRRGQVAATTCTTEQADDPGYGYLERGLGWVPHMNTHAGSVVIDLTRATLLSPHLRDQAGPHLAAARRLLGEPEFQRLSAEADTLLRKGR